MSQHLIQRAKFGRHAGVPTANRYLFLNGGLGPLFFRARPDIQGADEAAMEIEAIGKLHYREFPAAGIAKEMAGSPPDEHVVVAVLLYDDGN